MSKAIRFCSILLVFTILFGSIITKAATQTAYIDGTNVNLRAEPSTNSASLAVISGTMVPVTVLDSVSVSGWEHPWYKVSYNGVEGYIYGNPEWFVIPQPNPDANLSFEESLKKFPESYHSYLRQLHEIYPNWKFIADNLTMSFDEAVNNEYLPGLKWVELSQGVAWRSLYSNAYDWGTDSWGIYESRWVYASREVVAYYMDPRNFLNPTYIYMFLKQSFDSATQNQEGLAQIINGTFLADSYTPTDDFDAQYGGSYSAVIMAAAQASNINPYIIASKIIAEQGSNGTSGLISGNYSEEYKGYYNFFNWGAYGENPITAGLQRAKDEGWNSRAKAIIEGAKLLANGYINARQDTYYYMDFNLVKSPYYSHQYASAAYDAYNKAYNLSKTYASYTSAPLTFSIPVFTSIPDTISTKAETGDNRYNNYYLTAMSVDGLSPTFNMYNQNYTLNVSGNTSVYVQTPSTASIVSGTQFSLVPGTNTVKITVKAESGFTNDYTLTVIANAPCTLNITTDGSAVVPPDNPSTPTYQLGDTNLDGKITILDLGNIQKHLLKKLTLSGTNLLAADTNGDGKITILDLGNVQKHLLKKLTLGYGG